VGRVLRRVTLTRRYAVIRLPREWLEGAEAVIAEKQGEHIVLKPVR